MDKERLVAAAFKGMMQAVLELSGPEAVELTPSAPAPPSDVPEYPSISRFEMPTTYAEPPGTPDLTYQEVMQELAPLERMQPGAEMGFGSRPGSGEVETKGWLNL